ncbi:MAG: 6-carboxytetrahydropterin synthase QueD [Pseudomonadota bacterium]|jgi:6-pyruvoyltetrahydropterin/6-carboxytetrahydropterin synthase|nr:6-carboxytetrahydropterin synthase QueD [Pseudomonadota bacterium]|tara:strand:+ start:95 stop:463 length:369 start_codon:yes stop_codon:yes gene_type:complete
MFKLIVKKEFSSAHILNGHPGDCKRMHGHNWTVEAKVEGNKINTIGMVIDFKDIKNSLSEIISKLDHRFLNDIEPFKEDNPTAENISKYIYKELSKNINTDNIKVSEIKLWETNNSAVIYSE